MRPITCSTVAHRRRRGGTRAVPVLACLLAASTACGSTVAPGAGGQAVGAAPGAVDALGQDPAAAGTVPGADGLSADGLSADGLSADGLSADGLSADGLTVGPDGALAPGGVAVPGSSGTTGGTPGSGTAGAPGGPGQASGSASGGAGVAAGMPVKGRGYDATTLLIGFGTQEDAKENGAKIGVNVTTGSQKRQAEAIVNDINARGGILGRKIKLIFHDLRSADYSSNRAAAQQAACETWTRDNQVFAAVSGTGSLQYGDSPLYGCLAKKDTPLLFADNVPRERKLYDRYPSHLYTPGVATVNRFGPGLIRSLDEQKYFTGWDARAGAPGAAPVKVGVLHSSDEPGLPDIYRPALAAVGQRDPEFFQLSAKSTQDYSSAIAAAVLRFSSKGVTHVITNGALTFWAPAANSQGYRPRLGVTTWDALAVAVQVAPRETLNGALGAGYMPHLDVEQANAPKDVSPAELRCRQIMEKAGQPVSSRTTMYSMLTICEDFWLIESSLKRGGALTTAAMRAGVEAQTQPVVGGLSFAMRYGPGQHDGAHAVRNLAYTNGGFRYTSDNRPLG